MTLTVLKSKPKFLYRKRINYGDGITEMGDYYEYKGKVFEDEGVCAASASLLKERMPGYDQIIFPRSDGYYGCAHHYNGPVVKKKKTTTKRKASK